MSWTIVNAVNASHLERRLRPLAHALATYANDEGQNVFPGVQTLQQALGLKERAVRRGLQELVARGVLVRDGFHRHTRRFRFDLLRLAEYRPTSKPCTAMQGSGDGTRYRDAADPALSCRQPCIAVPSTLHGSAADLHDCQNPYEQTAAAAARRRDADDKTAPPFKVYAAIAADQLNIATRERDDNYDHIIELTKLAYAKQDLPYDGDITRRAVDAAFASREAAKRRFLMTAAAIGPRQMSNSPEPPSKRSKSEVNDGASARSRHEDRQ